MTHASGGLLASMTKKTGDIRDIWSRFTTGVAVITTLEDLSSDLWTASQVTGESDFPTSVHGMTANALCSVSIDPPLLLLSVGFGRRSRNLIEVRNRFGVNFLNTAQLDIAVNFSSSDPDLNRSGAVDYWYTEQGTPMIANSLAYIDCKVVNHFEVADHVIFIGEAEHFDLGEGEPLVYYERGYRSLNNGDD